MEKVVEEQAQRLGQMKNILLDKLPSTNELEPKEIEALKGIKFWPQINPKIFSRSQVIKMLNEYQLSLYYLLGKIKSKELNNESNTSS